MGAANNSKSMMTRFFSALAALLALTFTPMAAQAQYNGQSLDEIVTVTLIEGWRRDDGTHVAGLQIWLAPGWKTYWRAPGEGGIPPRLTLRNRAGLGPVQIHWPTPEVFHSNGMRSIGYSQGVVFPLTVQVADGPLRLRGNLEIGICLDVCMPVSLDLRGTLPDGGRPNPVIAAALADRPLSAAEAGAGRVTCRLSPISDGLRVEARIPLPRQGAGEAVVIELPDPGIWVSEPSVDRQGGILTAVADIVPPDAGPFALNRSDLRFTILAAGRAVELTGCSG